MKECGVQFKIVIDERNDLPYVQQKTEFRYQLNKEKVNIKDYSEKGTNEN